MSEPAIDRSVLEVIRSLQTPDDEDLLARIVSTFIHESARLSQDIAQAIDEADGESVRACAHTLKSTSGNVGAHRVVSLARDLEMVGRSGKLTDAGGVRAQLQHELLRAISELELYLEALEAA